VGNGLQHKQEMQQQLSYIGSHTDHMEWISVNTPQHPASTSSLLSVLTQF